MGKVGWNRGDKKERDGDRWIGTDEEDVFSGSGHC